MVHQRPDLARRCRCISIGAGTVGARTRELLRSSARSFGAQDVVPSPVWCDRARVCISKRKTESIELDALAVGSLGNTLSTGKTLQPYCSQRAGRCHSREIGVRGLCGRRSRAVVVQSVLSCNARHHRTGAIIPSRARLSKRTCRAPDLIQTQSVISKVFAFLLRQYIHPSNVYLLRPFRPPPMYPFCEPPTHRCTPSAILPSAPV